MGLAGLVLSPGDVGVEARLGLRLQSVVINAGDPAGQTLLQDIGGASYAIEYAVDTLPAANSEYPSCRLLAQQQVLELQNELEAGMDHGPTG